MHVHFSKEQIQTYDQQGFVLGPKVLSDEQIATLVARIDGILDERVDFPDHLRRPRQKPINWMIWL